MRAKEFIVEYKREVTLQKIGAGLAQSGQRENLTPDQVIEILERIDPTPNKQYVLWLAKQYISGQFRTEDAPRVQETLVNFTKLKSRLPVEQRDIGRFDFYKLDELVDKLINPELSANQLQTSATGTFPVVPNSQVLYNGPLGQLSIPKTKEASCELGSGTKWCTAASKNNLYQQYSKKSPLYVWRDKSGDKFQFHFNTRQFMDARDKRIKHDLLTYFRTQHPVLKKLFAQQEAEIIKDPRVALDYASDVFKGRWPAAEDAIAANPAAAYQYAIEIIKGRWPAAEDAIARDAESAYNYARSVIKGPWPPGEKAIASNPNTAYYYANELIKGPWPAAEAVIATDLEFAIKYAKNVIKGRWPAVEALIVKNPEQAYRYASDVLDGRWPAGEKAIATDPELALNYANYVIKRPFPAGEKAIAKDARAAHEYARDVLKGPFPAGEAALAKEPSDAYYYARNVLKGPFPAGEKAIASDAYYAYIYAKDVLKGPFPAGEAAIVANKSIARQYTDFLNSLK